MRLQELLAVLRDLKLNAEEEYRRLAWLVRDHDKFGVISTGEASFTIFNSVVHFGRGGPQRTIEQLRDTWFLTVADIGGTPFAREARPRKSDLAAKLQLRSDKWDALVADWKEVGGVLSEGHTYASVIEGFREISESPEFTVRRIRRLLVERVGYWGTLGEVFSESFIQETLETHLSFREFLPFCRDFAMVAKLDYALQFWNELSDYLCIKEVLSSDDGARLGIRRVLAAAQADKAPLPSDWVVHYDQFDGDKSAFIGMLVELKKTGDPRLKPVWEDISKELVRRVGGDRLLSRAICWKQADLLVAILRRVVTAYQGLIRAGAASERTAIGVGFSYLRSDDPEKRYALYELLSGGGDGRERGLRWLIDEIASWEMLA